MGNSSKTRGALSVVACVASFVAAAVGAAGSPAVHAGPAQAGAEPVRAEAGLRATYIVQGASLAEVVARVRQVEGRVVSELPIINAVGAELTEAQANALRAAPGLRVAEDRKLTVSQLATSSRKTTSGTTDGTNSGFSLTTGSNVLGERAGDIETDYPTLVRAKELHASGVTGRNVTIAFVDTGLANLPQHDLGSRVAASVDSSHSRCASVKLSAPQSRS